MSTEKHEFNAEISKLMRMIIHNFYSAKEIFLRELISNASDAIDKARFNSLKSNIEYTTPSIKIYPNLENNTLTIEDNGIGMTKEEVINCLGTIAKSGTEEFVKNILNQDMNKVDLIGQFGVGFYSSFLVANKVQVITKSLNSEDDNVILWESDATDGYTITYIKDDTFKYGTKIILHINSEQNEYLQEHRLSEVIKKHSGYISYPIYLLKKLPKIPKDIKKENDDNENDSDENEIDMDKLVDDENKESNDENKESNDENKESNVENIESNEDNKESNEENKESNEENIESNKDNKESNKDNKESNEDNKESNEDNKESNEDSKESKEENKDSNCDTKEDNEDKYDFVEISSKPIWSRDSKDVTEEEYTNLYKNIYSYSFSGYQKVKHFKLEGDVEFSAILYIPNSAPTDLFDVKKPTSNIKLYVKKVLITDNCKDLYPNYLSFIVGIVDSQDLPLNVSRELLQQSKIIKKINKILVKKSFEMIQELANDETEYNKFYNNFSKSIKLAIHETTDLRSQLLNLLRFTSTKNDSISLDKYIENMKEKQQGIYYIIGNNLENVKKSVFTEKLVKNDYEVLLMYDPIDEYIMQKLYDYKDIKFINVIKDKIELESDEKPSENDNELNNTICTKLQEALIGYVGTAVISTKLESHPVAISNNMGFTANMERIIKAQALSCDTDIFGHMMGQKILEFNPNHKLIKKYVELNYNKDYAILLYNMALIAGGYEVSNVSDFLEKLYDFVK